MAGALPYPDLLNRVNWNYIGIDRKDKGALLRCSDFGLPPSLAHNRPFLLSDECVTFGQGRRVVDRNLQLERWAWLWEHPLYAPYALCVCSRPDTSLAKAAAARLMLRAYDMWEGLVPYWYSVRGYRDELPGDIEERCSFLVLTGVNDNSTPYKRDSLFTLLERFAHIPRVVVTAAPDPARFMGLLRHEFHHAMNLGRLPLEEELSHANG